MPISVFVLLVAIALLLTLCNGIWGNPPIWVAVLLVTVALLVR